MRHFISHIAFVVRTSARMLFSPGSVDIHAVDHIQEIRIHGGNDTAYIEPMGKHIGDRWEILGLESWTETAN